MRRDFWVRFISLLAFGLALLLLSGPAVGGVIEDAEKILREVQQDGPGRPVPGPPGRPGQLPLGSDSWSEASGSAMGGTESARPARPKGTQATRRKERPSSASELSLEGSKPASSSREVTQRKLSLFLLLILGLLVVLAAALGRRLERSE